MSTTLRSTELSADLLAEARSLGTATLHEAAGRIGALPAEIRPVDLSLVVAGPALPVRCPPGDNLWLHRAIVAAQPGEIIVCEVGDAPEHGYWGEVMAVAARARGIAGLVITGGVRDTGRLRELGFATFSRCVSVRGTTKRADGAGTVGVTLSVGTVQVARGDLVVGDSDGVVVVPAARAAAVVAAGHDRVDEERIILDRLGCGETTIDVYGLPQESA